MTKQLAGVYCIMEVLMILLNYVTQCVVRKATLEEFIDCFSDEYLYTLLETDIPVAEYYHNYRCPTYLVVIDKEGNKMLFKHSLFGVHSGARLQEYHIASPRKYRRKARLLSLAAAYRLLTEIVPEADALIGATPTGGAVSKFIQRTGTKLFKRDATRDFFIMTKPNLTKLLGQEI